MALITSAADQSKQVSPQSVYFLVGTSEVDEPGTPKQKGLAFFDWLVLFLERIRRGSA